MQLRTPVPGRRLRSLFAAAVLAVVLSLMLSLATPGSAAYAEDVSAPAPVPGEEAPVEPAPVEPAPAPVDPAPVEPAPVEPAPVEPAPVEPAPAPVEPAPTEPAPVEPAPAEPEASDPAPTEPAPVQPAPVDPEPTEPGEESVETPEPESDAEGLGIAPELAEVEALAESAYLSWTVEPLAAGSEFEIQFRQRTGTVLAGETWWTDWSAWSGSVLVADCSTDCTDLGDRDAIAGKLQVAQFGSHAIQANTATEQFEYRVRPGTAPTGRYWTDTSWRTATATAEGTDLGVFTTTVNAAFFCTAGSFYSLGADGVITLVTPGGTSQPFANSAPTPSNAEANALGIGPGGTTAFVLERSSSSAQGIKYVHYYSVQEGWQRSTGGVNVQGQFAGGAVNLADGSYVIAVYANGSADRVELYRFTPPQGFQNLGYIRTARTQSSSGDLAFDAAGNLFVVLNASNSARVYTVSAQSMNSANGGELPVASSSGLITEVGDLVGAAFDLDGRLYLSSSSTARIYNPATQSLETGTTALSSSTDLASCLTPSTLTIVKDVVGRAVTSDQFTISSRGPSGATLASAATTGNGTAIQATAGPVPAVVGSTYTFGETFSNNNASSYAVGYTCIDQNGNAIAVDTSTAGSGRVTIPSGGASVVCTIRNAPLTGSITVHKIVQDATGTTRDPGEGWPISAQVTPTAGTVALDGAEQKVTSSEGSAAWGLVFGSGSARAAVTITEQQSVGYVFQEGACIVRPLERAPYAVSFTSEAGPALENVSPGTRIECTFVNRELPTEISLTVEVDGNEPASSWPVSASGPASAIQGPFGPGSASGRVTPEAAYTLGLGAGSHNYAQVGTWTCDGGTLVGDVITLARGQSVMCTIAVASAQLVLLKHIRGTGVLEAEQFTLTATPDDVENLGLETVTAAGSETENPAINVFEVRPGTAYALAETSSYAYLGVAIERLVDGTTDTWAAIDDPAALVLQPGERAVIRFVNEAPAALALPLTGGIGADAYLLVGAAVLLLGLLVAASLLARSRFSLGRVMRT